MNTQKQSFDLTPFINVMDSAMSKLLSIRERTTKTTNLVEALYIFENMLSDEEELKNGIGEIMESPYYTNFGSEMERAHDIDKQLDLLAELRKDKRKLLDAIIEGAEMEKKKLAQ